MDIDALKTFVEVNRTRHFGQAAKNLYVTQSTVSARIRMLENRVGVPLFVRERNNIQLTAAGLKLLRYAENILTTWLRACQEISVEDEKLIPFVAGANPSLWDAGLQGWIQYMFQVETAIVMNAESQGPGMLARRSPDKTKVLAHVFAVPEQQGLECMTVQSVPHGRVFSEQDVTVAHAAT